MTRPFDTADADREDTIVAVLDEAFGWLAQEAPTGLRRKYRKMAADPFAFFRGSACLFHQDVAQVTDDWLDERTSRIWIHGDLHAENFGTYLAGDGRFVFDVNDYDEAYVGPFTWDLRRFAASIALLSWQKALPDEAMRAMIGDYVRAYLDQVQRFHEQEGDEEFALRFHNTRGPIHQLLADARLSTRLDLLDDHTLVEDHDRRFRHGFGVRELDVDEMTTVASAYDDYLQTIPHDKRLPDLAYRIKGIVGAYGFGIGSAGLPAYNILIEGQTEALQNDVILSMKQGNIAAVGRVVDDEKIRDYFSDHGHRTAVSQRALQAHADPLLGHTTIDGVGFVVSELSPHELDLEWDDLVEPEEMRQVVGDLGRATAKIHCVADEDSEQTLVQFQTEDAVVEAVGDRVDEFVEDITAFGLDYARRTRDDHRIFVDAFRGERIPGVSATG